MAKLTGGDWAKFEAATNATWMAYLVDVVLTLKTSLKLKQQDKRELRAFKCETDTSHAHSMPWLCLSSRDL